MHSAVWFTKDLKKEEMTKSLNSASHNVVFKRLKEILKKHLEEVEAQDRKVLTNFTEQGWSHSQAFRNGQKQELYTLLDLLSFVKE